MSTISDFLKLLLPPKHDASDRHVHSWRWVIVVAVVLLLANAAGGRGYLPFVPAYANAADVKVILELQLAEEIRNIHSQICQQPPANRRALQNVLEDYQRRYRELTGNRYPLPACA